MTDLPKLQPDEHADYKQGFRDGCSNVFPECPDTMEWSEVDTFAKWRGYRDGQEYRTGNSGKTAYDYACEAGCFDIELTISEFARPRKIIGKHDPA
jgi:hypothetical protein